MDARIRYPYRIWALEWAVKRLGLWDRYRAALGFHGAIDVPIARQVLLGVPFSRRWRAAVRLLRGPV